MKNISLPVNSYWYYMIEHGLSFDYRQVKPYWIRRFTTCKADAGIDEIKSNLLEYDTATFYLSRRKDPKFPPITFPIRAISVREGGELGFPKGWYFIIELDRRDGKRMEIESIS